MFFQAVEPGDLFPIEIIGKDGIKTFPVLEKVDNLGLGINQRDDQFFMVLFCPVRKDIQNILAGLKSVQQAQLGCFGHAVDGVAQIDFD